jgi:hypothetical protein
MPVNNSRAAGPAKGKWLSHAKVSTARDEKPGRTRPLFSRTFPL